MNKRLIHISIILLGCIFLGLLLSPGNSRHIPIVSFIAERMGIIDLAVYDSHVNSEKPAPSSEKILLVTIDSKSESKLGRFPWKRGVHGRLIDRLAGDGAKVIAFDVSFSDSHDDDQDASFTDAVRRARNVIVATYLEIVPSGGATVVYPFSTLKEALGKAGFGSPDVSRDQDQVIRRIQAIGKNAKSVEPFFLVVVRRALHLEDESLALSPDEGELSLGDVKIPLAANRKMLINYRFLPFKRISYSDALEGNYEKDFVKDKIVIVCSANDPLDQFKTPREYVPAEGGKSRILFGGEIHAYAVRTVLDGKFVQQPPDLLVWFAGVVLCALGGIAFLKLGHLKALPIFLLEIVLYFYFCRYVFADRGLWLSFTIPSLMLGVFWIGVFIYESGRLKNIFTQFVPKSAVDGMLVSSQNEELGGKTAVASVLFSDIRGYTTLSEKMTPDQVMNFINDYHLMTDAVMSRNKGMSLDYGGDSLLVSFGAPDSLDNHETWAVKAAVEMQEEIGKMKENPDLEHLHCINIGIGICTGEVSYGLLGQKSHKKYTVLGDVVNTAARLQSISEVLKCGIIIDEATRDAAEGKFQVKDLGKVNLKGKALPVQVFGVCENNDEAETET